MFLNRLALSQSLSLSLSLSLPVFSTPLVLFSSVQPRRSTHLKKVEHVAATEAQHAARGAQRGEGHCAGVSN